MIGLDTNILARYYIEDDGDAESLKQREAARRLIEAGKPYAGCEAMASFDDRRFARRVKKLALIPNVMIPR